MMSKTGLKYSAQIESMISIADMNEGSKYYEEHMKNELLNARIIQLEAQLLKYQVAPDVEIQFKEFSDIMVNKFPMMFSKKFKLVPAFIEQQYKDFISEEKGRIDVIKNEVQKCFQYIQNFKKERVE